MPSVDVPSPSSRATLAVATLAGALIGGGFFLWLSSLRFVDPTETGWLMKFDWATHYFGWKYFRFEPWQWPPGRVTGYNAPIGTAIGLTDSLPLMAYVLKPFSRWLPEDVQYLGAWELLCFTLQGALGARLIGRFTLSLSHRILGATLFVLLPMLIWRVAHAALLAHWLLLWCLLLATRPAATMFRWQEWAALGLLAGLIQPYLAAMVAALLGATTLAVNGAAVGRRVAALGAAAAAMLGGWWLSGMFILGGAEGLTAGGLGVFSTNLLGPISPYGWSRLLPEWPHASDGQLLEGVHYYGAGVLLLIAGAAVWAGVARWRGRPLTAAFPRAIPLIAVVLAAVALSPRVTLGDRVLVDLSGPWAAPLALFRSTGRFLWPFTYVLLTWAVVSIARRTSPRVATGLLALGVAVQAYDLADFHADRRATGHNPAFYQWDNPFVSTRWGPIAQTYAHLVLTPPPQCGASPIPSEAALWFASKYRLSVNTGTLSRGSEIERARYCRRLLSSVAAGDLDPNSLYLVSDEQVEALRAAPGRHTCGQLDGLTLCSTDDTAPVWQRHAAPVP